MNKKINKLLLAHMCLIVLIFSCSANASEAKTEKAVASIAKFQGKVKYHQNGAVRGENIEQLDFTLYVNDSVRTKKESTADLKLIDNSRIILTERSRIHFEGFKQVAAEQGIVLFDINKQAQLNGFQVKSNIAVVGVKGTQFAVSSDENKLSVYMKEGLVSIESVKGSFKRYQQKEKEEFDKFQEDMKKDFETFNKELKDEFVEFVKSFELAAGKAIAIDGNEVRDISIPPEIEKYFLLFDEQ